MSLRSQGSEGISEEQPLQFAAALLAGAPRETPAAALTPQPCCPPSGQVRAGCVRCDSCLQRCLCVCPPALRSAGFSLRSRAGAERGWGEGGGGGVCAARQALGGAQSHGAECDRNCLATLSCGGEGCSLSLLSPFPFCSPLLASPSDTNARGAGDAGERLVFEGSWKVIAPKKAAVLRQSVLQPCGESCGCCLVA